MKELTIEELVARMDLTLVVRGTCDVQIMRGDKQLACFHGADWQVAARAWLDGWRQSQEEHHPHFAERAGDSGWASNQLPVVTVPS